MSTGKVLLLWAGGKESALAYKKLVEQGFDVVKLCVITDQGNGVYNGTMRGVRTQRNFIPIEIIQAQADALGLELIQIASTDITSLREYYDSLAEWATLSQQAYATFKLEGGTHVAFGYHDSMCLESKNAGIAGLEPIYPLMGITQDEIVDEFINSGFKARVIRTNPNVYGIPPRHDLCGKEWDAETRQIFKDHGVSVIGEDGSFGTICYEGPIFNTPLNIKFGEVIHFNVDEMFSTTKLADMNAFNVLQVGATRSYLMISL